jgi:hypothetical protein
MRKINSIIKSVIYVLLIAITYYFRGYDANDYYGYNQINLDVLYFFILLMTIVFGAYLFYKKYENSADYFLLLYGMIVVIPYGVLNGVYNGQSDNICMKGVLLLLPFWVVSIISNFKVRFNDFNVISQKTMMNFVLVLSLIVVALLLSNPPSTASFSLLDSYTRRLEARDIYGSGTVAAYLSGIIMNSALPLLVLNGVLRKEISYIVVAFSIYVVFYYLYGVKAPLLYMIFSGSFGYFLRKSNGLAIFYNLIYYILLLMFVMAWIEFLFYDYSAIEDYIIRRVYYVGSYLISVYFEALKSVNFSWMSGLMTEKSASMYIGEDFLGLLGANANTNTFLYFLLQYGLLGYCFSIALVSGFLLLLNSFRFFDVCCNFA